MANPILHGGRHPKAVFRRVGRRIPPAVGDSLAAVKNPYMQIL
jgi:hypothetical protein